MKKFLLLLAFAAVTSLVNAQSTTTTTEPEKTEAVEKAHSCAGHQAAGGEKAACCKGHGDAKAAVQEGGAATEAKPTGCCAGKAKAGASCHGAMKAEAGDAHDHAHGELKEHACTDACKDGAHAYACGEKGHACSADCHHKL